ncbi:MAG TPA: GTP cyclohydrolase II [Candidatus Xenobia bacterium]|nr:GTP cyclohydrolase II [Candidatus Xenobia bacterium]
MNRKPNSNRLRKAAEARLPTRYGRFRVVGFENKRGEWIVALVRGNLRRRQAPLVRLHSQCLTGDVFGSVRCDCRAQLELALKRIAREGAGILLYDPQEGRGIGLINKLRAYQWQDRGLDTVEANRRLGLPADRRSYEIAAEALRALNVRRVRLLSNNPDKVAALELNGISVAARLPCQPAPGQTNRAYLRTKREKLGHLLTV